MGANWENAGSTVSESKGGEREKGNDTVGTRRPMQRIIGSAPARTKRGAVYMYEEGCGKKIVGERAVRSKNGNWEKRLRAAELSLLRVDWTWGTQVMYRKKNGKGKKLRGWTDRCRFCVGKR